MGRVVVTGGVGFIGYHVSRALLARGDDVLVLDDVQRRSVSGGAEARECTRPRVRLRRKGHDPRGHRHLAGDGRRRPRRSRGHRAPRGAHRRSSELRRPRPLRRRQRPVGALLDEIHDALLARAKAFRAEHTREIDTKEEFYAYFAAPKTKDPNDPTPIHGGFAMTHFSGDVAIEKQIKDDLGVTVRCIPLDGGEPGTCPFSGKPSAKRVVWAKSY